MKYVEIGDISFLKKVDIDSHYFQKKIYIITLINGEEYNVYDGDINEISYKENETIRSIYVLPPGAFVVFNMTSKKKGLYRLTKSGFGGGGGSVSRPSSRQSYFVCYLLDLENVGKVWL